MSEFHYPFAFSEDDSSQLRGTLSLEKPLPYPSRSQGSGFYRLGKIKLDGYLPLDLVLYNNQATETFMYLRTAPIDLNLMDHIGISSREIGNIKSIILPGQLCLGSDRSNLIGKAIDRIFAAPPLGKVIKPLIQQNLAVFPIAREGLKYQVAEAIFSNFGLYVDEIVLDAHHVFDSSVPLYNRKVEMTLFKDKDLDKQQRENIIIAFLADSIASGMVMKEVIARVKERFDNIKQVEVIAPLATVRGLCRIARSEYSQNFNVRVHVFETLLNALPPDYYYSAHFAVDDFHIRPDLEREYRDWWGKDNEGNSIADTACAGYGWSEVFYSPRKQIQMINSQLTLRHNLSIADIVRRHI